MADAPHPNRHTHGLPTVGDVLYARKWRMPFKVGIHLMGYSRGDDVTCFSVPEWRIQLDVGEFVHHTSSSYLRPSVIAVTNPHMDHSFCLPIAVINPNLPIRVLVPAPAEHLFRRALHAAYAMNDCGAPTETTERHVIGMSHLGVQTVEVGKHNHRILIRAFEMEHTVPCLSYGFAEVRPRLKAEYKELDKARLSAMRKGGVQLEELVESPAFLYAGASSLRGLARIEEALATYPVVIVQCTYLEPADRPAHSTHTSFAELSQLIKRHASVVWVLVHLARGYSDEALVRYFAARRAEFPNVVPWLNEVTDDAHTGPPPEDA